ncbi:hypothetical protein IMZ48_27205 [Candidatus Bathyarchaeota archaeon]|nr:hypothetical protein [Candidatus Bathyarchaeota archaeon]
MDELRKLSLFTAQQSAGAAFKKPSPSRKASPRPEDLQRPSLPSLISIHNGNYSSAAVGEADLLRLGRQDNEAAGSVSGPALEMVVVSRVEDDSIELPSDTFDALTNNMGIDPVTLQHVYMCSYGFYHYDDCRDPAAPSSSSSGTRSFFFGCFLFSLAWSVDIDTGKTSAILILRTIARHYYGALPLKALEVGLRAYKDRLGSPLSLAFILLAVLTHILDDNLYRNVKELRDIEGETKHGPSSKDPSGGHIPYMSAVSTGEEGARRENMERQDTDTGMQKLQENENNIEELTRVAKKLADVNVHLANLGRHAKLLRIMAETLGDRLFRKGYRTRDGDGNITDTTDTEFFLALLPSLQRRLAAMEPSIEYLEDRAKGQHQVVGPALRFRPPQLP